MNDAQHPEPAQTPRDDLARQALEHYEQLATEGMHWNSVIPAAIELWRQAGTTPEELMVERRCRTCEHWIPRAHWAFGYPISERIDWGICHRAGDEGAPFDPQSFGTDCEPALLTSAEFGCTEWVKQEAEESHGPVP